MNSVGNEPGSPWDLSAGVWGDANVSSITAHFRLPDSAADAPDAATTTAFTSGWYGWTAPAPTTLPQVGVYDVSLDVTDDAGNTESFPDVGTFTYDAKVTVGAFTASRSSADYDHRTVTLTAPVTVTDPSTGQALDPTGLRLGVAAWNNPMTPDAEGTVDADGRLSVTVTPAEYGQGFILDPQDVPSAASDPVAYPYAVASYSELPTQAPLTAEQTRIRILTPVNVDLPRGGHTVIKGVLERKSGSTWVGTSGENVNYSAYGDTSGHVRTGSGGIFQVTVGQAGGWYFDTYYDTDAYLDSTATTNPVTVHIPSPTSITGLKITEDAYGEAIVKGDLYIGPNSTFGSGQAKVEVQYSKDDKTWHNVYALPVDADNGLTNDFSGWATWDDQANGYWRVHYAGTPDWAAATSKTVKLYRTVTRVTGGKPSRTHVSRNGTVYFSGHVQQRSSSTGRWSSVKNGSAYLLFRPYKSTTWYWMSREKVGRSGAYSLHAKAPEGGTWCVVWYTGDSTHLDATGPMTYVHV